LKGRKKIVVEVPLREKDEGKGKGIEWLRVSAVP
jgi:hypothetical protein